MIPNEPIGHMPDKRGEREGPLRVLLVDDNVDLQMSLASIFQSSSREIRTAANGLDALELAKEWHPEVVFLDIHMPGLNGFQVAKRLREQYSRAAMKLVLMSGVSIDEALVRDARQAGFDDCIDKMAPPDQWFLHLEPAQAA